MANDFYLVRGTVSKPVLLADASNRVKNWTLPSDINPGWGWLMVTDGLIAQYAERQPSMESTYGAFGHRHAEVRMAVLSPAMWEQMDQEIFNNEETAAVTIQFPNRRASGTKWQVWNTLMTKPDDIERRFGLHGGKYMTDVPFALNVMLLAAGQSAYSHGYSKGYA